MTAKRSRPLAVKGLVGVQILLSIISIPSGALLLYSPSGQAIGAQTILPNLTQAIPFLHDFAPVGIFLLTVYGLLPIVLAIGLWLRYKWAWALTLLLGVTEMAWIASEVAIFYSLGFFFFYPIIAGMGAVNVALCLVPSVRRFYNHDRLTEKFIAPSLKIAQK
jgi:hypothetical protein